MEVHHSHHPGHKKKWHEYVLEFLMLFFAVFLGFLAENIREHKVEKHRTEGHMHTMVENLKYDTTRYGSNLKGNLNVCQGLDSFRYELRNAIAGQINANKLYYYYWKFGRAGFNPVRNETAISQLKSSGLLRMIKDDSLVNQIGDYYTRVVTTMDNVREGMQRTREQLNDTYRLIFNMDGFDWLIERDTSFVRTIYRNKTELDYIDGILVRNPALQLLNSESSQLKLLYNDISAHERQMRNFNAYIRYCHQEAEALMERIKKVYHFE